MIIHLTGPDTYRSRVRLHQLRDAFVAKHDPAGFNVVMLDGLTATVAEIRAAVSGGGLFAKKNFVALNGYDPAASSTPPNDVLAAIEKSGATSDTIIVIRELTGAGVKKKSSRGKKAVAAILRIPEAKREEFPALTAIEAKQWLVAEAKRLGSELSPALAEQLVAACDNDVWRMAMELDKLSLHAGSRPITAEDISELVVAAVSSDMFALTDAIGGRNRARALHLLHQELAAGVHPLALIAMIARHLRTLRQVQEAVEEGLAPAQIAPALDLHPFVVQKALAQSKKFTRGELATWHRQLLETDWYIKSTPLDAEVMLDVLIGKT